APDEAADRRGALARARRGCRCPRRVFGYARRLAGGVRPARAGADPRTRPLGRRLALPARHRPRPPRRDAARIARGPPRPLAARPRRVPRRLVPDAPVPEVDMNLRRTLPLAVLLPALCSPLGRADVPAPPARWVVVTAPAFRDAALPLCKLRTAQKLDV